MGKKMAVRGRPGLLFVAILILFLAVFFLTWKSMISPNRKSEVKDIYSMNYQASKQGHGADNHPRPNFNDIWHEAKLRNGGNTGDREEKSHDRDEEYRFNKSPDKQNHEFPSEKSNVINSPLSNLLHATKQPSVKDEDTKPYYKKPDESLKIIGGRMERLVHLDLKGAAPKVSYLKEIFPLFSRLGATGLLMEYEDMFPYSGELGVISAENSYTKEQIEEILSLAKLNSLKVIPLIQTFGHMEFVLKALKMQSLRESNFTPQVINVASNTSYALIQEMVSQILAAHPSVNYLHVGCDEVYELGKGKSSDIIVKEKVTSEVLFLRHVKRVADIVAQVSQKKVRPIIWDDELRKMPDNDILASGLPSSVDIMVWRYTQNITDKLNETVWKKYGRLFKTVWAASSFKGATGPRQLYTEPQHHIINHFSWIDALSKYGTYVSFKGIALTGWQRFDHFATLCELLPVAIPSLAVCLATIKNGGFDEDIHKITSSLLDCSGMIEMGFPELDEKEKKAVVTQDCRFPGHMIYYAVQELWGYKQFDEAGRRMGWLSDYQIKRGFSNPGQLKVLSMRLFKLQSSLLHVQIPLEDNLQKIFTQDTVDEWLDENIFEEERKIKATQEEIKPMMKMNHWARRPNLPVVTDAPVAKTLVTASPHQNKNDGSNLKRNVPPGVQTSNENKMPSAIQNNISDLVAAKQKQAAIAENKRMVGEANRGAIAANENLVQANKYGVPGFNDMSRKNLGTGDASQSKLGLFRKSGVATPLNNNLFNSLKNNAILESQRQSESQQNQNSLLSDTRGQVDHLKRLSFNQGIANTQNKRGPFVQNNQVRNANHNIIFANTNDRKTTPLSLEAKMTHNAERKVGRSKNVYQPSLFKEVSGERKDEFPRPVLTRDIGMDRNTGGNNEAADNHMAEEQFNQRAGEKSREIPPFDLPGGILSDRYLDEDEAGERVGNEKRLSGLLGSF